MKNNIKRFLINVRDYCYTVLVIRMGQAHAEKEYKNLFIIVFGLYYMTFLTMIAILHFKLGIPVPDIKSFFAKVLVGLMMLTPYYLLSKFILKKLSSIPIRMNVAPKEVKKAKTVLLLLFMLGIVSLFIIPWALSALII